MKTSKNTNRTIIIVVVLFFLFVQNNLFAQVKERPFILITAAEHKQVIEKINTQKWAKNIYSQLLLKTDKQVSLFLKNPENYIKQLPFNWNEAEINDFPPFYKTDHVENGIHKNLDNATREEWMPAQQLIKHLQVALDCSMIYYVNKDEKYAYVASSILYTFIKSVQKSKVSDWQPRGGWLFPYDGFREVREIGYQPPLIYDFIAPYLNNGGQSYDIVKNTNVKFPFLEAQQVFRTYANITVNYGQTNSNHPVLESPNLVYNALAMNDEIEREQLLSNFLTNSTKNQDALNVMANNYKEKGDIWPETSQYLNHSTAILTKLMLVVNKYNPSLKLGAKYSNILFALPRLDYFVYPNDEIIRWGDGHRKGTAPYQAYDDAFTLAKMDGLVEVSEKIGPLLVAAMQNGKYKRTTMESVFWHNNITSSSTSISLPRTDRVYHAGIVMQRNLSSTNKPEEALMCFVGGAQMVHGHAEGMNIELYGEGQVLGVDNGRGKYAQDIHENYSRIFAAHNTVIVNGSSQGEGGWSNLGINKVELISMEPAVGKPGVSSNYSFSQTSFKDTGGENAEAMQERTLALIRTSSTTGYYVDVFRSKSKFPNEYHDYLYHNIGDELEFENKDLILKDTPDRFMANANANWKNGTYRNPGWHFFNEVKSSSEYTNSVNAIFKTTKLNSGKIYMQLHIPGFINRQFTSVKAPLTFEAPEPYDKLPTPTLVIRNTGEAWKNPFVVVFEPFNEKEKPTITSVKKIEQEGIYKGLIVNCTISTHKITQYLLTQSKDEVFESNQLGISFKGTFAVITCNDKNELQSIYIGEGDYLKFKDYFIQTDVSKAIFKKID